MGDGHREEGQVIPLLPYHLDPESTARRSRGRPQRLEPQPSKDDISYHAQVLAERARVVEADQIVKAASKGSNPKELLGLVVQALAADAALLGSVRDELSKRGRQTEVAQITSRRAALLDRVAALTIEIDRCTPGILDVRSEAFMKVFELWVDELKDVASEILTKEQFGVLFTRLEVQYAGFEERVEERLR